MDNQKATMARLQRWLKTKFKAKLIKNQTRNRSHVKTKLKRNIRRKVKNESLFKMFNRLDIKDLVSVTEPSKEYTESILSAFKYKYTNDVMTITNANEEKNMLPLSTKFLHRYGKLVKKLIIKYHDQSYRFDAELEKAIVKYCRNSVTEIEFINVGQFALLDIKKPFRLVQKVVFTRCTLGKFIFEFNKWFPNAQSLDLVETKILRQKDAIQCLKETFKMFDHMGIVNPRRADEEDDHDDDIGWEDDDQWEDDDEEGNQNELCADSKKTDQDDFEELLCNEFEAKCLGTSWQPNHTRIENGIWAKYEKR